MRCLLAILLLVGSRALAAAPSAEELGAIFGYPPGEIVVQDITTEERQYWIKPSEEEERKGTTLPSPQSLIAAYSITGKNPATFYPIRIWIAQPGTFLNPQSRQWIAAVDKNPPPVVREGVRNPLGSIDFDELGKGGGYLAK